MEMFVGMNLAGHGDHQLKSEKRFDAREVKVFMESFPPGLRKELRLRTHYNAETNDFALVVDHAAFVKAVFREFPDKTGRSTKGELEFFTTESFLEGVKDIEEISKASKDVADKISVIKSGELVAHSEHDKKMLAQADALETLRKVSGWVINDRLLVSRETFSLDQARKLKENLPEKVSDTLQLVIINVSPTSGAKLSMRPDRFKQLADECGYEGKLTQYLPSKRILGNSR